jgi:hypothetical protein
VLGGGGVSLGGGAGGWPCASPHAVACASARGSNSSMIGRKIGIEADTSSCVSIGGLNTGSSTGSTSAGVDMGSEVELSVSAHGFGEADMGAGAVLNRSTGGIALLGVSGDSFDGVVMSKVIVKLRSTS